MEVTGLLREFGGVVTSGETLEGARGMHKVDVVVRTSQYGIDQLWICECKDWNRRVPKERLLTFAGVVGDVGADRGLMFPEQGFQAGAIRMARNSNISLTSLEDLRESGRQDPTHVAIRSAASQAKELLDRLQALMWRRRDGSSGVVFGTMAGVDLQEYMFVSTSVRTLEEGLHRGLLAQYPVTCGWTDDRTRLVNVETSADLVLFAAEALATTRAVVTEMEKAAAEAAVREADKPTRPRSARQREPQNVRPRRFGPSELRCQRVSEFPSRDARGADRSSTTRSRSIQRDRSSRPEQTGVAV